MIYKDTYKRQILYKVQKELEKGTSKETIKEKLFVEIEGSKEDKDALLEDCFAYLEISNLFEIAPDAARQYAEIYIEENEKRDINLVDEKLVTVYIKTHQLDKAKELVNKLLKKEPNNRWAICKKFNIYILEGKYDRALGYINHQDKEIIKEDPAIFNLHYRVLAKRKPGDFEQRLILVEEKIMDLKEDIDEKKPQYIEALRWYYNDIQRMEEILNYRKQVYVDKIPRWNYLLKKAENAKKIIASKIKLEEHSEEKTEEKDSYKEILKRINKLIGIDKENPQIDELVEQIDNENLRFALKCQIVHARGIPAQQILYKIKSAEKLKKDDEQFKKISKVLQNFLTSKDGKFYLHGKWTGCQRTCINVILKEVQKEENAKEEKTSCK